jgi:hypothetical protein
MLLHQLMVCSSCLPGYAVDLQLAEAARPRLASSMKEQNERKVLILPCSLIPRRHGHIRLKVCYLEGAQHRVWVQQCKRKVIMKGDLSQHAGVSHFVFE